MIKFAIFGVAAILLFGTYSCTCERAKDVKNHYQITDSLSEKKVAQIDYFSTPSPDEMFAYINTNELEYISGITLPPKNAANYLDYKSQVTMLGVYASDLAYVVLFKQQDEMLGFLNAMEMLVENAKFSSAFDKNFASYVMNNKNNPDSLAEIASQSYIKIISYLVDNDMQNTLAILLNGAYIESLYLFVNIQENKNDVEMIQKIADQKYVLDNLYEFSQQYLNKPADTIFLNNLEKLRAIFNSLDVRKEKSTNKLETESDKLVIESDEVINITDEQYKQLKSTIFSIRQSVVEK